jgi:hypothetical protein
MYSPDSGHCAPKIKSHYFWRIVNLSRTPVIENRASYWCHFITNLTAYFLLEFFVASVILRFFERSEPVDTP